MSNKPACEAVENAASNNASPKTVIGQLFVVAAPSGAGKSSLVNALLARDDNLSLSISHTTRPPRPGESEGHHYHFVSEAEFLADRANGEFLEHARVFDHWYGTSRRSVARFLDSGRDVILEIDWQGAEQVRQQFPDSCHIFILPPSVASLLERLKKRGQDSEAVIERRMRDARAEMVHYGEFDYVVINDDFETALHELHAIVIAQRLQQSAQRRRHESLLQELLQV